MKSRITMAFVFICLVSLGWVDAQIGQIGPMTQGRLKDRDSETRSYMERMGYKFGGDGDVIALGEWPIVDFPWQTKNPYGYDESEVYVTDFDVSQWLDGSNFIAVTGWEWIRNIYSQSLGERGYAELVDEGKRISVFLGDNIKRRQIGDYVRQGYLLYLDTMAYETVLGAKEMIPCFQLMYLE